MKNETFSDPETLMDEIDTKILCLIKFGKKEHLEELSKGKIRAGSLSYYRDNDNSEKVFYDKNEGINSIFQSDQIELKIKDHKTGKEFVINSDSGLTGQVYINVHKAQNAFCLYAIHTGLWTHKEFTENEIQYFKDYITFTDHMRGFGDHVWVIINGNEFNDRLGKACINNALSLKGDLIRYIETSEFHGKIQPSMIGLIKDSAYQKEREYRYLFESVDPNKKLPHPLILDIGDLSDISMIMTVDDFLNKMEIKFK